MGYISHYLTIRENLYVCDFVHSINKKHSFQTYPSFHFRSLDNFIDPQRSKIKIKKQKVKSHKPNRLYEFLHLSLHSVQILSIWYPRLPGGILFSLLKHFQFHEHLHFALHFHFGRCDVFHLLAVHFETVHRERLVPHFNSAKAIVQIRRPFIHLLRPHFHRFLPIRPDPVLPRDLLIRLLPQNLHISFLCELLQYDLWVVQDHWEEGTYFGHFLHRYGYALYGLYL